MREECEICNFLFDFSTRTVLETKGWDVFRDPPIKELSGSMAKQKCLELSVKITKVLAYVLTFIIVLASAVISKGTLLFMTSQLKSGKITTYCNKDLGKYLYILSSKNELIFDFERRI